MKILIIFLSTFFVSLQVFATAQIPDKLIYKGDTLSLHDCPLEFYPNRELINPKSLFGSSGCFFTACWRNYIATWEIIDNQLYLTEIRNACYPIAMEDVAVAYKSGIKKNSIGLEFSDLKKLFPDNYEKGKVKADWVTHNLISPQGELLYYVHNEFESSYERDLEFHFEKGVLTGTKLYDNSKSKKSVYHQDVEKLLKIIYSNIRWDDLPKQESIIVVHLRFSANEESIIDEVDVIKGFNETYDQEAIRVVKLIPEWDTRFKKGELVRVYYSLPIIFSEEKRLKYKE